MTDSTRVQCNSQDLFATTPTLAKHSNYLWNVTLRCKIERGQALARIGAGRGELLSSGEYREFANEEILKLRAVRRESGQTSPYRGLSNELPGIFFEPPESDRYIAHTRYPLMRESNAALRDKFEFLDAH